MRKALYWLIIILFSFFSLDWSEAADYVTLRKFLSARMYGEAYNELLRQELSGNALDPKLKSLKIDLLDRTNEKLQKQAKVSPDDATVFTILADIAFQKGDYDRASQYASTAITNNGNAMANYIFAKILFRKGNVSQAFDQMGKVLEAMPESPIIFNDFQFLYTCKRYGVDTAKKLTKDSSFIIRSTPIAYDGEDLEIPESPFINDPTETAASPDFSDYNRDSKGSDSSYALDDTSFDDDLDELSKISSRPNEPEKPLPKVPEKKTEIKKEAPLPDEIESDKDSFDEDDDVFAAIDQKVKEEEALNSEPEEDPEAVKIKEAEQLLLSAKTKFRDGYTEDAYENIKTLNLIYPNLPGKQELEDKINYEINIMKRYKDAIYTYDLEESKKELNPKTYDEIIRVFQEAYNYKPKSFPDAPYYIGRCFLLKTDPDPQMAIKYFDIAIAEPRFDENLKRDMLWTKFEIHYEDGRYEEAKEIFDYFLEKEKKFAEQQDNYISYFYGIWLHLYFTWIIAIASIFIVTTLFVFILQFLPDLAIGGDALKKAQKAFDSGNFNKVVKYAEKELVKKQPIQRDRQLRELLVKAYFVLENFEKCQYHAKAILKEFPDNNIAWSHLAKASVAIKDTSNEAIKLYEDLYRSDSSRTDLLPILAHHYAAAKNTTPVAMELLQDYHRAEPEDKEVILALAEGYVKNRTMIQDIVPVLSEAIALNDKIEYRELLARTFSKCGLFNEAARECVEVLKRNINNIGIHVVYTSSMKKLNQTPKAIEQYKEFISQNPGNNQLIEILNGLKKEAVDSTNLVDDVPKLSDELGMPGMDMPEGEEGINISDEAVANFIEPPPDGFEEEIEKPVTPTTPVPDFMKEGSFDSAPEGANQEMGVASTVGGGIVGAPSLPEDIQTLDPFADDDSLFDGFDTEELPEELGGTARPPVETSKTLDSLIDDFNASAPKESIFSKPAENDFVSALEPEINNVAEKEEAPPDTGVLAIGAKIEQAKDFAAVKNWDKIIDLLVPEFASDRNRDMGMLLIDAWLGKDKPEMALEIIQTLDFDPEMMSEKIKDILYRTAVALEMSKKYKEALGLYDAVCNADINYRDAFDRSDRLYSKMKNS